VAVTLAPGGAGFRVAGSINKEVRLRFAERQLSAYERLWDLMEPANPNAGPLDQAGRQQLEQKMTNWYYVSVGGMTLRDACGVPEV
jgi:hypothetical protein